MAHAPHAGNTLRTGIEQLFDRGEWSRARWLLEQQLLDIPDDHWLHMQVALSFFEDRRLEDAHRAIARAAALAPECPSVLWYRAGILHALGRLEEAHPLYRAIVERPSQRLNAGACGLTKGLARGLIADAWLRLHHLHRQRGERQLAGNALDEHLDRLGPGCFGLYTLEVSSSESADGILRRLRMRGSIKRAPSPPLTH